MQRAMQRAAARNSSWGSIESASLFLYQIVINDQNIGNELTHLVLFSSSSDERCFFFGLVAFFECFFGGTDDIEDLELSEDADTDEAVDSDRLRRAMMVGKDKIRSCHFTRY